MPADNTMISRRAAYILLGAFEIALFSMMYEYVFQIYDAEQSRGRTLAISLAAGVLNGLYVYLFFDFVFPAVRADGRGEQICPLSPFRSSKESVCTGPEIAGDSITTESLLDIQGEGHKLTGDQSLWRGPEHCVNETCVFANDEIGGGIVLVTNNYYAQLAKSFPRVSEPDSAASPPFYAAEVPGKGVGLVANRTIHKGEILMVKTPSLMAQAGPIARMEEGTRDMLYDLAIGKLPAPRRDEFMNQMGEGVHGKVDTNCFQLFIGGGEEGSSHVGCYPEISRFNHDCRPNVHYRINNMTHTTVAVRDIPPGEELSISYIDLLLPRADRRRRLHKWGFECGCAQCAMGADGTAASDARLRRIARLKADLGAFNRTVVAADTGAELVALYEAERLDSYLGNAYTRAALNYALFGEEEKARAYAGAAVEALEREYGPGFGDAKAMRVLAENPRAHWTWGKRRKQTL
ncbi:hypothetical protein F5X99DRAFT_408577 [Biscogniauxia marginata]|nr:hypothetical protein F5X99DRAFT_408577 [Biscogniauxia marginata]